MTRKYGCYVLESSIKCTNNIINVITVPSDIKSKLVECQWKGFHKYKQQSKIKPLNA